ncbi:MAG: nuclear transport factor 2 family protein [Myxococcales bacterium]|nr:nuclear transport factor 2 family protein [Myxococcales bacterium]
MIAQRRHLALAALGLAAGCSGPPRRTPPPLADQLANGDRDLKISLRNELRSEILDSYERDDVPDLDTALLPTIGAARIGVGPGDFLIDQDLVKFSSRWPLTIDPAMAQSVRSKHLDVTLAADTSAAWMFDEVSWRLTICGRTLVIPLRLTALYARDGDRWIPALEHLSWGAAPVDLSVLGSSVQSATVSQDIDQALEAAIAPLLQAQIPASPSWSKGPDALMIGPDWSQEWRGLELVGKALASGKLELEDKRSGVVGRSTDKATVAYWVGNLRTTGSAPQRRLRASFVFERHLRQWVVVQGHVSAPIDDESLARLTVGSALAGLTPLTVQCQLDDPR